MPIVSTTRTVGLVVKQGDDHPIVIPVLADGAPVDCTGWTARSEVRTRQGNLLHRWSTEDGSALCGPAGVTLLTDESESWEWKYGNFDVVAVAPDGTRVVPVEGVIRVNRLWTR